MAETIFEVNRIIRNGYVLLVAMALLALLFWGWEAALSVSIGGAVAALNFRWMSRGVDRLLQGRKQAADAWTVAGYLLRLVLIFMTLFAMIHFSFLSLPGVLAGLAIFVLAGMLEALILLLEQLRPGR